jgi:hypothetical protein
VININVLIILVNINFGLKLKFIEKMYFLQQMQTKTSIEKNWIRALLEYKHGC